jgi:hypothetical protein
MGSGAHLGTAPLPHPSTIGAPRERARTAPYGMIPYEDPHDTRGHFGPRVDEGPTHLDPRQHGAGPR